MALEPSFLGVTSHKENIARHLSLVTALTTVNSEPPRVPCEEVHFFFDLY